ncbi:MAG: sigma-70 family RNA polymerase sigma factor [Saprospiraceae bacterium]|uniref:Sigma-70 family RNA polymerase sigma factor n=1 Tax=Candidatus Opimibacter skivensis TaxID=2982028 RepID=A0A9D7SWM9_9BACT|nr:sigma-70 family RNA polymerase sigma factor [Candidatus Opimibacter skivensis]
MSDVFPVNLTEVYTSPGNHPVENMHQLDHSPLLRDEHFVSTIRPGGLDGEKAIISLYTHYHKSVRTAISDLIKLYPACRTEPDDIVHDAFLVMIHKIQFETAPTISLKAFWIGISRKLILNQVRKFKRITLVAELDEDYGAPEISPESLFMITEHNEQIENYLSRAGERCKQVLIMWLAQFTMGEIADELHLSGAQMARKIKYACFKKLKNLVQNGHMLDL